MNLPSIITGKLAGKYLNYSHDLDEITDNSYVGAQITSAWLKVDPEDPDTVSLFLELDNGTTLNVPFDSELNIGKTPKTRISSAPPASADPVLKVEPKLGAVIGIKAGTFEEVLSKLQAYLVNNCSRGRDKSGVMNKFLLDAKLAAVMRQTELCDCNISGVVHQNTLETADW